MAAQGLLSNIYNTRWTNVNNFNVTITQNGSKEGDEKSKKIWENLDFYIQTIATPDTVMSPNDNFSGYEWILTAGRKEVQRMNLTFRDKDEFLNYRNMRDWWEEHLDAYPDECSLTIKITQDYLDDKGNKKEETVFNATECYLESVSNLTFARSTASQIGEFSGLFRLNPDKTYLKGIK